METRFSFSGAEFSLRVGPKNAILLRLEIEFGITNPVVALAAHGVDPSSPDCQSGESQYPLPRNFDSTYRRAQSPKTQLVVIAKLASFLESHAISVRMGLLGLALGHSPPTSKFPLATNTY